VREILATLLQNILHAQFVDMILNNNIRQGLLGDIILQHFMAAFNVLQQDRFLVGLVGAKVAGEGPFARVDHDVAAQTERPIERFGAHWAHE